MCRRQGQSARPCPRPCSLTMVPCHEANGSTTARVESTASHFDQSANRHSESGRARASPIRSSPSSPATAALHRGTNSFASFYAAARALPWSTRFATVHGSHKAPPFSGQRGVIGVYAASVAPGRHIGENALAIIIVLARTLGSPASAGASLRRSNAEIRTTGSAWVALTCELTARLGKLPEPTTFGVRHQHRRNVQANVRARRFIEQAELVRWRGEDRPYPLGSHASGSRRNCTLSRRRRPRARGAARPRTQCH